MYRPQNSILIIAALAVLFGLIGDAGVPRVSAQSLATDSIHIDQNLVTDYLLNVRNRLGFRDINLESKFSLDYQVALNKNGTIDLKRSVVSKITGDSKLRETAVDGIRAFSDAGYFGYLANLGVEKAVISISHDGENFSARVVSDMGKMETAKTVKSGLNLAIQVGRSQAATENDRLMLGSTMVLTEQANLIITLALTKTDLERLILW